MTAPVQHFHSDNYYEQRYKRMRRYEITVFVIFAIIALLIIINCNFIDECHCFRCSNSTSLRIN